MGRAGEMAGWLRAFVALAGGLTSLPSVAAVARDPESSSGLQPLGTNTVHIPEGKPLTHMK